MNLSDLLKENVERQGERPLLRHRGKTFTNLELDRAINRAASGLAELGVKPGDRVTLVMGNSPELIIAMFACFKIGAWAMPVVLSLRPPELALILMDAEPTTLIAHRLFIESIQEPVRTAGQIRYRIMIGKGPVPEGWLAWDDWTVAQSDRFEARDCEPDEIALLLYTSGTTGNPKGVMLSHMNLYANAINTARSQGLHQDEHHLLALPLNHSFGITAWLAGLYYGMQVALLSRFDPVEVFHTIARHQIESTAMVPTMLAFLLDCPDRDKDDISSLKRIVVGAAPLRLKLRERFEKTFPGIQLLEAYGLTEASPGVTVSRSDRPPRARSVGQSVDNQEVAIIGPDGKMLGPGEVGEVCTRGPHVMVGYYKRPEETARVIRNGWLYTGDVGYLDEDGFLYLTGRLKELIIRGGENIYPEDIETAIRNHPEVREVAAIGIPDEVYGEEVAAVVVLRPGSSLTEDELRDYCKKNMARFQVPKKIVFTTILPRTPMGKVRKRDLRTQIGGVIGSDED